MTNPHYERVRDALASELLSMFGISVQDFQTEMANTMMETLSRAIDTEMAETRAELARHHRDFEAISTICADALEGCLTRPPVEVYQDALRQIRNMVG